MRVYQGSNENYNTPTPRLIGDVKWLRSIVWSNPQDVREDLKRNAKILAQENITWEEDLRPIVEWAMDCHRKGKLPAYDQMRERFEKTIGWDLLRPRWKDSQYLANVEISLSTARDQAYDRISADLKIKASEIQSKGAMVDGVWRTGAEAADSWLKEAVAKLQEFQQAGRTKIARKPKESLINWPKMETKKNARVPLKGHPDNVRHLIEQVCEVGVRHNVMTRTQELECLQMKNAGPNKILSFISEEARRYDLGLSERGLSDAVTMIEERYHPVQEWILSRPWDGRHRLEDVVSSLQIKGASTILGEPTIAGTKVPISVRGFAEHLIRTWCFQTVSIAMIPVDATPSQAITAQGVLTLIGRQSAGKSRWFKTLAGQPTHFLEGIILDPANKDSVLDSTSRWIVELGELDATYRKADLAELKAFVTKSKDVVRLPYARTAEEYVRRTSFCATCNHMDYLRDDTGNRRWWTVPVEVCDVEALQKVDIQQFWAEMWHESRKSWAKPYLAEDWEREMLEALNEQHTALPAIIEQLVDRVEPDEDGRLSMGEIRAALGLSNSATANRESQDLSAYMRRVWHIEKILVKGNAKWPVKLRGTTGTDGMPALD